MNKVILMGRLTRKPEISWNEEDLCIARFTLAVDRRFKREGQQDADFIGCVAFGKNAEFADKYLNQGTKIALEGRIQTGILLYYERKRSLCRSQRVRCVHYGSRMRDGKPTAYRQQY